MRFMYAMIARFEGNGSNRTVSVRDGELVDSTVAPLFPGTCNKITFKVRDNYENRSY